MRITTISILLFTIHLSAATIVSAEPPAFVAHRVGTYRSEACGVGDFNNDGKLDIVAGPFVYLAPDWNKVKIRTLGGSVDEQGRGYMYDFMNVPLDVDGDGLLDVVSCSWHEKRTVWFRNTGTEGGEWPMTVIEVKDNFEAGDPWDVDGDGRRDEIVPATKGTVWYEVGKLPDGKQGMLVRRVSDKPHDWGAGAGDVNGDGRCDILRPGAWFEAPEDIRGGTWKEHPLSLGGKDGRTEHTPQICVYDVNRDGLNDIVTSSAHKYGIYWYQQIRGHAGPEWKQHTIDDTWSQAHSITLADLDADGDLDLVTGKRFLAHNGNDPGGNEPPGVYWYELGRGPLPKWTKHVVSFDEGIGSGINIPVADIDADGDLDIVVTGKWGGPVWFENKSRKATR